MTLSRCTARCTVERMRDPERSEVWTVDRGLPFPAPAALRDPVRRHVARLLERTGADWGYRIGVQVDFPVAAGLAASAAI